MEVYKPSPFVVKEGIVSLFVYGSLKPGFGNHRYLSGNLGLYPAMARGVLLYDTRMGFPAVAITGNQEHVTHGFLVDLPEDSPALANIDRLEGWRGYSMPDNHYQKNLISVNYRDNGENFDTLALVYHYTLEKILSFSKPLVAILEGDWTVKHKLSAFKVED